MGPHPRRPRWRNWTGPLAYISGRVDSSTEATLAKSGSFDGDFLAHWRRRHGVLSALRPFFSNRVGGLLSPMVPENKNSWRRGGGGDGDARKRHRKSSIWPKLSCSVPLDAYNSGRARRVSSAIWTFRTPYPRDVGRRFSVTPPTLNASPILFQ